MWGYSCLYRNTYFCLFFWQPRLFVLRMGIDSILEHYLKQPHRPLILDVIVAFLFAPFLVLHHNTSLPKKTYININSMQINKFVSNPSFLLVRHYFILLLSRQNVSELMQRVELQSVCSSTSDVLLHVSRSLLCIYLNLCDMHLWYHFLSVTLR